MHPFRRVSGGRSRRVGPAGLRGVIGHISVLQQRPAEGPAAPRSRRRGRSGHVHAGSPSWPGVAQERPRRGRWSGRSPTAPRPPRRHRRERSARHCRSATPGQGCPRRAGPASIRSTLPASDAASGASPAEPVAITSALRPSVGQAGVVAGPARNAREHRLRFLARREPEHAVESCGEDLAEVVPRSYYGGAWSADSQWFFYTVHDEAYRPHEVWRHRIGTPVTDDVRVLTEPDERFDLNVRGQPVRRRGAAAQREPGHRRGLGGRRARARVAPRGRWAAVGPGRLPGRARARGRRRPPAAGHQRRGGGVPAGAVRPAPAADQDHTAWTEVRPEDPAERLERVDAFAGHVVMSLRTAGEHRLRVVAHDDLAGEGWCCAAGSSAARSTWRGTRRTTSEAATVWTGLHAATRVVRRRPRDRRGPRTCSGGRHRATTRRRT